jgi:PAS domain-containing protein
MLYGLTAFIVVLFAVAFVWLWRHRRKSKTEQAVDQLKGALKSKEVQAEILIESIADGIIVIDTNDTISLVNKAAATMTEWTTDEALGLDVRAVLRLLKDVKSNETIPDEEHPAATVLKSREPSPMSCLAP